MKKLLLTLCATLALTGIASAGKSLSGTPISEAVYTFDFACTSKQVECLPQWAIPIDANADGRTESYAYVEALTCGFNAGQRSGTVTTSWPACNISYGNSGYGGWSTFVADRPGMLIGPGPVRRTYR